MSYLGYIPQTSRFITEYTVGSGSNQTISYDLGSYKHGFIDVYVNSHKISGILHLNDPDISAYYYTEGIVAGTFDGRHISINGLNHNDIVEIVNYSVFNIAGSSGSGSGSIDQLTFNTLHNSLLSVVNGFEIDGGTF